jgi:hypothetical protein
MFQEMKLRFHACARVDGYKTFDMILCIQSNGEEAQSLSICSDCLSVTSCLNRVGVNLPDEIVMVLQSHCHQAATAL